MPVFAERTIEVRGRECRLRLESFFEEEETPQGITINFLVGPRRLAHICWMEGEHALDAITEEDVLQEMADELAASKRNPSPFTLPDYHPWMESFNLPQPREGHRRFWER